MAEPLTSTSGAPDLVETVRRSVIGEDEAIQTPFGLRRVTYADYTASGRSLAFVEDLIREAVLPLYANTHSESSGTGLQTTRFREEARAVIRDAVGGEADEHVVLFCGSGSTGAINTLIGCLGLRAPGASSSSADDPVPRPVVFIGPYEHHSNELPWRESVADVVTVPEDADGMIDLGALERALRSHEDRAVKLGSFSAASNVTGILSDVEAISSLLHRHGALAFWDYAAAAPYVEMNMGSAGARGGGHLDAVFISPHKFVGGPGTPGVLVARRALFTNPVPDVPGGGTVAYVNPTEHRYLEDVEHREEGGTPDIVGSIRAGLVFQLKEAVGVETIRERERSFVHRAMHRWQENPSIEILGSHELPRLSIVSFVVRRGARYVHHNAVVAILNDLFGIQSRGGCSCAGPYGHRLLGIDPETSHAFEREIARGCEGIKPGWVRVSFNYFSTETEFDYVLDAVDLVAEHGWKLLPKYRFDAASGRWSHVDGQPDPAMSMSDVRYGSDGPHLDTRRHHEGQERLASYLDQAREALDAPARFDPRPEVVPGGVGEDFPGLRWFWLPEEITLLALEPDAATPRA